jgi:Protein phosphatase 2C
MGEASDTRQALLRGREHTLLGRISAIAERAAAIAISRGGARKTYAHKDPNEDAAGFAASEHGTAILVADGHSGYAAAEIAIEHWLEVHAARWLAPATPNWAARWNDAAVELIADLNNAVIEAADPRGLELSRTTLALAIARPLEAQLAYLSIGDSHIFCVGRDGVREIAAAPPQRTAYLGHPGHDAGALGPALRFGSAPLDALRGVVLATDGLSERGIGVADPAAAVAGAAADAQAEAPALRPLALARALAERALAAQRRQRAGDNVATAVFWNG